MSRLFSTIMIAVLLLANLVSSAPTVMAQTNTQELNVGATPTPDGIVTGVPESITSTYLPLIAGEQRDGDSGQSETETVCVIPTGAQGIHYEASPDVPPWGPSALVVGSDQTFWIADAAANQILQFDAACKLVSTISLDGSATAPTDLAVTEESLWVLDASSQQAAVLNLSPQGVLLAQYPLPESLDIAAGLSGITVSPQDELLIEQENGAHLQRMIDSTGSMVFAATSGYTVGEQSIQVFSGGLASDDPSTGYIKIGSAEIPVSVANDLGGLHILGFAPDGSFYAALEEVALRDSIVVDQRVRHYDPNGILLGEARSPVQAQYTYVPHALAVGTDGNVYFLATRPTAVEIQKLHFVADLAPVIPRLAPVTKSADISDAAGVPPFVDPEATPPPSADPKATLQPSSLRSDNSIQACAVTRETIMINANNFINNSTSLSTANVDGVCSGRGKPHGMVAGIYKSVPYDWGGKLSLVDFNSKITQGKQAGDINYTDPVGTNGVESCSVGVDCSGFIARVWNMPSFQPWPEPNYPCCDYIGVEKLKQTYTTLLTSVNELQRGDILAANDNAHVVLFDRFGRDFPGVVGVPSGTTIQNGFYTYEATTTWNADRVVRGFRDWTSVAANPGYKPYRLKDQYLCISDADDGRTLILNQPFTGRINTTEDLDSYKFNGTQGQVVEILMTKTDGSLDSYLTLYDTNGNWLTSDDDSGGGRDSLIRWTLPALGMYRIEAKSYGNPPVIPGSTGGYQLIVRTPSQAPAAPSNLTATALDSARIQLSWRDNANNESGFQVYDGSTLIATIGANLVSYTVTGLAPSSYHCYAVRAYNNSGSASTPGWTCTTTLSGSSGNLALNRPAYATSQESATYAPAKGNDGNLGTRWSSQWSATARDEWWRVDLGTQTFDQVTVRWETAYATQYFIGWSNDGVNFTGYSYTANSAVARPHNLGTRTARYVAVKMSQRAPCCGNYSLFEFEVYRTVASAATQAENAGGDLTEVLPDGDLITFTLPQAPEQNTLFLPFVQH